MQRPLHVPNAKPEGWVNISAWLGRFRGV